MPTELVFLDLQEHYDTATGYAKWTNFSLASIAAITPDSPLEGNALLVDGGVSCLKVLEEGNYNKLTVGFWYKAVGAFGTNPLVCLGSPADPGDTATYIYLWEVGDGTLKVVSGFAGPETILPDVRVVDTWYFIEFIVDAVARTAEVWLVSLADYNLGQNTEQNGTTVSLSAGLASSLGFFYFQGPGGIDHGEVKTIYVTNGPRLGALLGDTPLPRAEGDTDNWIGSSDSANYSLINEVPPDLNSSYIVGPAAADAARYYLDLITYTSRPILGAQALRLLTRSDAGPVGLVTPTWKNGGGTIYSDPTDYNPAPNDYLYQRKAFRYSPFTGVSFTAAEIDASQLGLTRAT